MITVEKTFPLQLNYDLFRIGDPEKMLFFDIETTGLSAANSALYLIGALYIRDGVLQLKQFLSESLSSEQKIIKAFFALCEDFDVLVHFNGDHFDLPFVSVCANQYGLETPFKRMKSIDIYRTVRHYKHFFEFENYKQKSIEKFLEIDREDLYSGGELIPVYEEFSRTRDEKLLKLLLLHNEEDLLGMPGILPVLNYTDVFSGKADFEITECYRNKSGSRLFLTLNFTDDFPVIKEALLQNVLFHFENNCLFLSIPLYFGTLKYFYPDWKDYFYLPKEDRAIHKKVAQFVDPAFREKAKPENCYQKNEGFFLPAVKDSGLPEFRNSFKDPEKFHLYEQGQLKNYLKALFSSL